MGKKRWQQLHLVYDTDHFCRSCHKPFKATIEVYTVRLENSRQVYNSNQYCSFECWQQDNRRLDDDINGKEKLKEQWR